MNDFLDDDHDDDSDDEKDADAEGLVPAVDGLPVAMLEHALTDEQVAMIRKPGSFCLAVEAPSAAWVAPIAATIRRLADWDCSETRIAPSRARDPGESVDRITRSLAKGGRAFGVATRLELLPAALRGSADLVVRVGRPTPDVIARTIEMVTGERPLLLADDLAIGMDFDEIAASIRMGTSVQDCIKRLERVAANRGEDRTRLSDVPDLENLHGYGAAMDWAKKLLSDLAEWRRSAIPFSALAKNAVLASEPGLGKTTFVRSLAKSSGLPLVETSVGKWFSQSPGYLDSIIKQIDEVFSMANARAPAIVFLDECDAIPSRLTMSPRGADWWTPVIAHMLTRLDGATSETANLIVIGATNHPEKLDPALVRPGRLSRIIEIERADEVAVAGILRQHLGGELPGADLGLAAGLATGFSGAEIAEFVRNARGIARSRGTPLDMEALLEAIAPPDDRSEDLLRRVAIHEAGHAVVGHEVGFAAVRSISIVARGIANGTATFEGDMRAPTLEHIESFVLQLLGGRAAEDVVLGVGGTGSGGHPASDLAAATRKLGLIHLGLGLGDTLIYRGDEEDVPRLLAIDRSLSEKVEADLQRLLANAKDIVRDKRALVDALVAELLAHRRIDRNRFLAMVEATSGRSVEPVGEVPIDREGVPL